MKNLKISFLVIYLVTALIFLQAAKSSSSISMQFKGLAQSCLSVSDKHLVFLSETFSTLPYGLENGIINCIDKETGKTLWTKTFNDRERVRDIKSNNEFVCIEYDFNTSGVWVMFETHIICYSIDKGAKLWEKTLNSITENDLILSMPSSMLIHNNNLYFHYNKLYYRIDLTTGNELCKTQSDSWLSKPIAAKDNMVIYADEHPNKVICIINDKTAWSRTNPDVIHSFQSYYPGYGDFCYNCFGKTFSIDIPATTDENSISFFGFKKDTDGLCFYNLNLSDGATEYATIFKDFSFPFDDIRYNKKCFIKASSIKVVSITPPNISPSIVCFNADGTPLWSINNYNYYVFIDYFSKYLLFADFTEKKNPKIKWLRQSSGKEIFCFNPDMQKLDNAVIEGSDLFIFGEGKLQRIDLSTIDISTRLKYNMNQGTYTLNGITYTIDTPIETTNNRVFISANNLLEPLCGKNEFENKEGIITATLDDKTLEMQLNNPIAKVDGKEKQIDPYNPSITPYINKEGYIMVPLRFIAESIGCKILFNPDAKEIIVTYQP